MDVPYLLPTLLIASLTSYVILCSFLRHRRINSLLASIPCSSLPASEIYSKITLAEAERIVQFINKSEFPYAYTLGHQFALFRTYAIPSISRILQKTNQLTDPQIAGRRYSDTVVLVVEMSHSPLDSERARLAIARTNYMHSLYPQILPQDTLYTICLLVTQSLMFIERFEWRAPTLLERAAVVKYWTEIGIRMGVPADTIPRTYPEMVEYYQEYDRKFMIPAESNQRVAIRTLDLYLYWAPTWIYGPARKLLLAVCDDLHLKAMMFERPPSWAYAFITTAVNLRRLFLRYLCLPRWGLLERCQNSKNKYGKYWLNLADNEPWYVQPTFWGKWGFWGLVAKLGGWPQVGQKWLGGEGYEIETIGPEEFKNRPGVEKTRAAAEELKKFAAAGGGGGGCPFR